MTVYELVTVTLSGIMVIIGLPSIITMAIAMRKDREAKIAKDAVDGEKMKGLREDVDHAHDKIRVIMADNVDSKVILERFMTNLEENTRVLRLVEDKIGTVDYVKARLDAHLESHV